MWLEAKKVLMRASRRTRVSVGVAAAIIGATSTVSTILGVSLGGVQEFGFGKRLIVLLLCCITVFLISYIVIGFLYKRKVSFAMGSTQVEILVGDIFRIPGYKVIGCDAHFDTRIDDIVISKTSLHGQFVRNISTPEKLKDLILREADRLGLVADEQGLYRFPLGTVLRYDSDTDGQTFLLLAMTELDEQYKSCTNIPEYESMLMTMWGELDRLYAKNDLVIPLLGSGITRFKDGSVCNDRLLRCMLCTLDNSGVNLKAKVRFVIRDTSDGIPLYEYKSLASSFSRL